MFEFIPRLGMLLQLTWYRMLSMLLRSRDWRALPSFSPPLLRLHSESEFETIARWATPEYRPGPENLPVSQYIETRSFEVGSAACGGQKRGERTASERAQWTYNRLWVSLAFPS
jgi:hypothetical protein